MGNEFGDFQQTFSQEDAASMWMDNDQAAMQDGMRQCLEVTRHWMDWVQAQVCEVPPGIRFDYFVGRSQPGKAFVWTLEICELGFSMLGEKQLPQKVFSAMLKTCLSKSPVVDTPTPPVAAGAYPNGSVPPLAPGPVAGSVGAGSGALPKRKNRKKKA